MSRWYRLAVAFCVSWGGWLGTPRAAGQQAMDDQIGQAIVRMQDYVLSQQQSDGSWENGALPNVGDTNPVMNGQTAAAVYALLMSGMSFQHPALDKAILYLREAEVKGVYAVSLRTHIWALLPDEYLPQMERDARWLMGAHWEGLYDYTDKPRNANGPHGMKVNNSLSRTQYGVLGVWEVVKRGGKVNDQLWQDVRKWMTLTQLPDGG